MLALIIFICKETWVLMIQKVILTEQQWPCYFRHQIVARDWPSCKKRIHHSTFFSEALALEAVLFIRRQFSGFESQ